MWEIVYTKQAHKDAKKLSAAGLRSKAEKLLKILAENPYQKPPFFEKLVGDLDGAYSRRINIQHRLIYQIFEEEKLSKLYECGHIMNKDMLLGIHFVRSRFCQGKRR